MFLTWEISIGLLQESWIQVALLLILKSGLNGRLLQKGLAKLHTPLLLSKPIAKKQHILPQLTLLKILKKRLCRRL